MTPHDFSKKLLAADLQAQTNVYCGSGALAPAAHQLQVLLSIIEKASQQRSLQSPNITYDATNLVQSLIVNTLENPAPVKHGKPALRLAAEHWLRAENISEVSAEYDDARAAAEQAVRSCATKYADALCAQAQQRGHTASQGASIA